ncbi:hypothetical protein [Pseudomonas sp. Irchel 3A5]|jgi:hypothetical protein|uniref:hypothetical protein n=1 Tax=Pseudomonas sp. Irchel 3A5 TaxID=2008911 RepID=UPI000BA37873|nr:hypothetical protein [Pseudomonas sp. Irchel 3A5]
MDINTPPEITALNPLIIPAIDISGSGGLGNADLADPTKAVPMLAILGTSTAEDDFAELFWDGVVIDDFPISQNQVDNGRISFKPLPLEIPDNPAAQVFYRIRFGLGGNPDDSPIREVRVKRTVPGNPDPNNTTPTINENLVPPEGVPPLIDTSRNLDVTVPPWLLMAEGDVLTLYWGGNRFAMKQPPLPAAQVGKPQVVTVLSQTLIDAGDSEKLQVNYDIRDVVGNWSLLSLPAFTNVQVDPSAPAAPRVVDADTNLEIDLDKLGARDVRVETPAYTGIALTDNVTLVWEGQTAEGNPVVPVLPDKPVENIGFGPYFDIPNKSVVDIAGGHALVYYKVAPAAGGPLRRSRSVTVAVVGDAALLLKPILEEAVGTVIDPDDVAVDAHVIIKPYTGKGPGDVIYLTWEGKALNGQAYTYTDDYDVGRGEENDDYVFLVPKANLVPLPNGTLTLSYKVKLFTGNLRPSDPADYSVAGTVQLLPKPTVENAPGDILDPDLHDRTVVHINGATALLKRRDEVIAYWTGAPGTGSATKDFLVASDNQNLSWSIVPPLVESNRHRSVAVRYEVRRYAGAQDKSAVRTLQVKAILPLPDILEDDAAHVVDIANLTKVTVRVPDYGMVTSDTVMVRWQGVRQRDTNIRPVGSPPQAIEFDIPILWAQENLDKAVTVTYSYGRGVDPVVISPPQPITIINSQTGLNLIRPTVPAASAQGNPEVLDFSRLPDNTDLIMRVNYDGMYPGQTVRGQWIGRVRYTTPIKEVTLIGPMDFIIPRDEVIDSIGSTVSVSYTVVLSTGAPQLPSKILPLRILPQALSLVAPTINAANTTVSVAYGASLTTHTIVVRWKGVIEHRTAIQHPPSNGGTTQFTIPAAWVTENRGKEVLINYSVGVGDARLIFSQLLRKVMP